MTQYISTRYRCDGCGKEESNVRVLGSGGGLLFPSRRYNWVSVCEEVESGCPEEGIPFEREKVSYDLCPDCINVAVGAIYTRQASLRAEKEAET